jgi:RNA polymerase sigma-70 factor, ECF subfamily
MDMMVAPMMEVQAGSDESSNIALMDRCQMNDKEACNELLSRYNRKIFNTAYRILGEEASAEDALQETLLNVYRGLGSFRGESKISTWISKITINVCLGMLRKDKNRQYVDLDDESTGDLPADRTAYTDPLEYATHAELRDIIEQAFVRMSGKQGIVVRLHDMEGNTIQEIAKILHCPVGTIKSRLFYGRQEFKAIFQTLLNARKKCTVQ